MSKAATEEPSPPVSPGDVIAGKFRVERVLGSGGMAFVVAARHEELGQLVAIKLLRPDLPEHNVAAARFLREARAAARIQSDHVARVFDVGMTEGDPYMVMEYLEGADLDEILLARGKLPIAEAVDHTLEALEAVAHAHALGIVHRDLKPANMFLASRPDGSKRIKVLDFGISKASGLSAPGGKGVVVTSPNAVLGSPAYMSPEQARSSTTVDLRTDLWSIGVILYELISGRHPFNGDTAPRMLASIARDPPIPLRSLRSDAPEALEQVILRCLTRDLEARYQNAAELAHALTAFGSERTRGLASRISLVLGAPAPSAAGSMSAVTGDSAKSAERARPSQGAALEEGDTLRSEGNPPPNPETPTLETSTKDPLGNMNKSPTKGKLIVFGLTAAVALSLGIVASAAWRATAKMLSGGAPPRAASTAARATAAPSAAAPSALQSTTERIAAPDPSGAPEMRSDGGAPSQSGTPSQSAAPSGTAGGRDEQRPRL
jgi:serine/threonine-protein kinase